MYPETRKDGDFKMSRQEMKDYAIRNWGHEDMSTIELFIMDQNGSPDSDMANFILLVEESRKYDFGFEI